MYWFKYKRQILLRRGRRKEILIIVGIAVAFIIVMAIGGGTFPY